MLINKMKLSIGVVLIGALILFFQNCSQQKVDFSVAESSLSSFGTGDLASCPTCLQPKALSAGSTHMCAVAGGAGYCWGLNLMGQLGDGTQLNSIQPVAVLGLESGVQAMGSSLSGHQCAIVHNAAKCWGSNMAGQVGNGSVSNKVTTPVEVMNAHSGVQAISSGGTFTCMIQNGAVKCWGATPAHYDVRQNGSYIYTTIPVTVPLSFDAKAIATGAYHACALLKNNEVWCWGDNYFGQLGNGTKSHSFVPVKAVGLSGVEIKTIVAAHDQSCALLQNGHVKCWGSVQSVATTTPTEIAGISSAVDLSLGQLHSCAIFNSGQKQCWDIGGNAASVTSSLYEIVSGGNLSCALTSKSTVNCWGWGGYEQAILSQGTPGNGSINPLLKVNFH